MQAYDPGVIQAYADDLYAQAERAQIWYAFGGGTVGLIVGFGTGIGAEMPTGGFLLMGLLLAAVGAGVGFAAGRGQGARMRLQAQTALCQVAIEQAIRETAKDD